MRLGILGGTFDPIHYGHLLLAETCREQLNLTEVRLLPAGAPPHKTGKGITDGHTRADMAQLAISGYPEYRVDRREIRRDGPSFTVDTLTDFRAEFPEAELFFLLGADSLRDMPMWKQPERILELATVVAVNRPGLAIPSPQQVIDWVGDDFARQITVLSMPGTDLSATALRQRVAKGRNLRFMTPRAVEMFIIQHQIYAAGANSGDGLRA
jgi:nicotinate-nucleotide adenylyltransferase